MRIGIDIDDTLVSSSEAFELLKKKYNDSFNKKFKDNWTEEEKKYVYDNYLEETLKSAKLKEDAKNVLDYLNFLGHELYIITARGNKHCKNIEEFTLNFLKEENVKVSKIYFREHKKSDLAQKLKLDLMIDDSDYVYENMKKDNIECIHFGKKIKTWKEVLDYIVRR